MSTEHSWQLVVDCRGLRPDERELLAADLWDHPISGIEERVDDMVVGFATEADARRVAALVPVPATVVEVVDDGYLDEWRRFARPSTVGRFFVRPAWIEARPPSGAVEIVIEPGRSFGSGGHASTRLALMLMQQHDLRGRRVLDVGCGSGILSIAACRLGAARVDAIDIDADAVAITQSNARRNDVEGRVRVFVAPPHELVDAVDVTLANVLPSVHHEIAPRVRRLTTSLVIVAGLLDAHVDDVASAYGGRRATVLHDDGWAAIALWVDPVEPAP